MLRIFTFCALVTFSLAALAKGDKIKGQEIYKTCIECHGEAGKGLQEKNAPLLAGQFDWYIVTQLKAFKSGERKNPEMMPFIANLSEQDFEDVAAYISSLR